MAEPDAAPRRPHSDGEVQTASHVCTVEGRQVRIDVRILTPPDRTRLAARIAWLAREEGAAGSAAFQAFASDVVGAHVSFTLDDDDLAAATATWWGRAVYEGATALFAANDLGPDVERALMTWAPAGRCAGTSPAVS